MKLDKVAFRNIRNFSDFAEFDFSDTTKINTISGKNGSGKSTIFKSIVLCQRAFFINQIEDNILLVKQVGLELAKFFTNKNSFIELTFLLAGNDDGIEDEYASFKIVCTNFSQPNVNWSLESKPNEYISISKSWNLISPKDIIVYVDSNKSFIETDVSYDNISISDQVDFSNLLLNTIINPERIFTNIYTGLIKTYLRERLVPAKPRKDLYYLITKIQLKELIPNIQLSNFSGMQFANQFVLLGKSTFGKHSNFYDVRNFSSGEKVLFYLLLFINYVHQIGMLIIDEPENHFHEDLLVKFIKMLNEMTHANKYNDYIKKLSEKHKIYLPKDTYGVYKNYNLSQIFLLTHSKNLIYNNLYTESNYYIDNAFKKIGYQDSEKTLRELGISSIYSKVLFVEGTSETDFFDIFFNDYNIKIHPLNGCHQVIDTYKKVKNIKLFLHDTHFCFLIDRDTRTDEDIEKLRKDDPDYFDSHFIVLDRHEFESYLLDEEIYSDLYKQHELLYPVLIPMTVTDIQRKIVELISSTREQVFRKHLSKLNGDSVGKLNGIFRKRDMPVDNLASYQTYLSAQFAQNDTQHFLQMEFETNYDQCKNLYSDANWNSNWKVLCDGKTGLSKVVEFFGRQLGVNLPRLKIEIKHLILKKGTYEINKVINSIISKFEVKKP